jgi:hypothetical protein
LSPDRRAARGAGRRLLVPGTVDADRHRLQVANAACWRRQRMNGAGMIGLVALALLLIFVSVAVHAVVVARMMMHLINSAHLRVFNVFRAHALLLFLVFTALLASHLLQAALWAGAYYLIGGFDDMATSLYFSLSSYTTVGFADVVLPQHLRLLGPLEAAIGVLMFGWSTGYIFAFATRMLAAEAE